MARIETTGGDVCYTIPNRNCGLTAGVDDIPRLNYCLEAE